MNAMIFAAGLGTRLYPITQNCPKALVKVNGKPLLWYAVKNAIWAGATQIVINVHHFADQIIDYVDSRPFGDGEFEIMISDEQDELLETGGGLLKAASLFIANEPILIINADVLTNSNLKSLVQYHKKSEAIATLMVEERKTSRYFLFDSDLALVGWENREKNERIMAKECVNAASLAFDGIQVVNPEILTMLGPVRKFSITNGYLGLAKDHLIKGWRDWEGQWFDIGTPEKLDIAIKQFQLRRDF